MTDLASFRKTLHRKNVQNRAGTGWTSGWKRGAFPSKALVRRGFRVERLERVDVFNSGQAEQDPGTGFEGFSRCLQKPASDFLDPVLLHLAVKGSPGDVQGCGSLFEVPVVQVDGPSNQGFFGLQ